MAKQKTRKESTLIIIKPNEHLNEVYEIVEQELYDLGFDWTLKVKFPVSKEIIKKLSWKYKDKQFFSRLVASMTRGDSIVSIWEGPDIIQTVRDILGPTDPEEAIKTNTLRGILLKEFGIDPDYPHENNYIHASKSAEDFSWEIAIFYETPGMNPLYFDPENPMIDVSSEAVINLLKDIEGTDVSNELEELDP